MTTTAAIEITDLAKAFHSHHAVNDVSFRVDTGRVVALLGPNGAGKTTTMRILLGLVSPDRGHALVDGRPYRSIRQPARSIGAVLDTGGLHPGRTARQHLRITSTMLGQSPDRIDTVLHEVGLADSADRRVGGYSLGMRQRLALANALLGDPSILVLDEPANGLDPAGIRWLRDYLRDFAARGGAVLISTHVLTEVKLVADDVVIIDDGRVLRSGSLDAITGGRDDDLEELYLTVTETNEGEAR